MRFVKLTLQNFLSIRKIELDLHDRGLMLIQGKNMDSEGFDSNGAGKSSVIDGLSWVLYGETVRGYTGDDIVNLKVGKNCLGHIDLVDDNGDNYRISRYRKHKDQKNSVLIFCNGEKKEFNSEKESTRFISELLQMDYFTFVSTILYSSKSFKFTSSTDAEMKRAFDVMLDLDVLNKCLDIAKMKQKGLLEQISGLESDSHKVEDDLDSSKKKLEQVKAQEQEYLQDYATKLKETESQIKDIDDEIKNVEGQDGSTEDLEGLLAEVDEELASFKSVQSKINTLEVESSKIASEIRVSQKSCNSMLSEIEGLDRKLADKGKLVGSNCPVCGSKVTKDSLGEVSKEIEKAKKEISSNISNTQKGIDALNKSKLQKEGEIEKLQKSLKDLDKIEKKQGYIQGQISKVLAENKQRQVLIKALIKNKETLEKSLKQQKDSKDIYKPMIKTLEKEIKEAEVKLSEISKKIKDKQKERIEVSYWIDAFGNSGIKSQLLNDVTPFLNQRANYYLQKLTSGSVEIIFSTQTKLKDGEYRDKFSIVVENKYGGSKYKGNSGGEQRRVDVAVNMALQDLISSRSNKKINIVWYDEVFDTLDETGCERVIEILQENINSKSSIFVTTHNSILKAYFDNSITMVKKGGFSYLEE